MFYVNRSDGLVTVGIATQGKWGCKKLSIDSVKEIDDMIIKLQEAKQYLTDRYLAECKQDQQAESTQQLWEN
jgi:hypothetical protein